jgi:DNA-directed RNA polymerase subunit K/omega
MNNIEKVYDSEDDVSVLKNVSFGGKQYDNEDEDEDEDEDKPNDDKTQQKKKNKQDEDEDDDDDEDNEEEDEEEDEDDDEDEDDEDEEEDEEDLLKENKKVIAFEEPNIHSEEDDDDEEYDENYLQKFNTSLENEIIQNFHPELKAHNYDEIDILSRVVRDTNGDIIDPLHQTIPFITKYEKARILGERAKQINAGAKPFVVVPETMIDGYLIALKEYEEKKIPFILKRPLPNGGMEYWKLKDLEFLD